MAGDCAPVRFVWGDRARSDRPFATGERLRTNSRCKTFGKAKELARRNREGADDLRVGGQEQRHRPHPDRPRHGADGSRAGAEKTGACGSDRHAAGFGVVPGWFRQPAGECASAGWFSDASGRAVAGFARKFFRQLASNATGHIACAGRPIVTRCAQPFALAHSIDQSMNSQTCSDLTS